MVVDMYGKDILDTPIHGLWYGSVPRVADEFETGGRRRFRMSSPKIGRTAAVFRT